MELKKYGTLKIWYLKTTNERSIVRALNRIKKGADKHIDKIPISLSLYDMKKSRLVELLIS